MPWCHGQGGRWERLARGLGAGLILAVLLACTGLHGAAPRAWTVMVYLDGDNDLAPSAQATLRTLIQSRPAQGLTLLVQVALPGRPAQRLTFVDGRCVGSDTLGSLNMAAPECVRDFVTAGLGHHPSAHAALILWDHGEGWRGLFQNKALASSRPGGRNRKPPPTANPLIAQALRQAQQATGRHLDLLGLDACGMATMEAAYEYRDVADYLVGSQDLLQDRGWDYDDLLTRLGAHPGLAPLDVARTWVESYGRFADSPAHGYGDQTLVVLRLGPAMEHLARALDTLAADYLSRLEQPAQAAQARAELKGARLATQELDPSSNPATYIDLQHFLSLLPPTSLERTALADLSQVVLAEYHGTRRPHAHGLSIVFFDYPRASVFGAQVFDPNYKVFDARDGSGSGLAFLANVRWERMMHRFIALEYPASQLTPRPPSSKAS